MSIRRWVIGIVVGVLALGVAAVLAITLLVDPNRFRGQIEAAVQDATGRPFEIRGDLDIAWFPWLAMRTGAAQFGNPPGIDGPPAARWESARVGVRLLPLIRGRLVIDRVRFDGLQVHLRRTADGAANWNGLIAGRAPPGGEEQEHATPGSERPPPEIAGFEIRDGALEYLDERDGTRVRLSGWQLDVGAWKPGQLVPVDMELTVDEASFAQSLQSVALELDTRVQISEAMDRVELHETELSGLARGGTLAPKGVRFEFETPRILVALSPLALDIPEWRLRVADAQLAGAITAKQAAADRMNSASGAGGATSEDPASRAGSALGPDPTIGGAGTAPIRAQGPLSLKVPSVRELLTDLGLDVPLPRDTDALEALQLKTSWTFDDGVIAMKPIDLRLDETTFEGQLARSKGEQPVWTFDLRGDRIDLARYLVTEDKSDEPFELPVDALKALRAQGTLAFDQARFAQAQLKNARVRLMMEDGELRTVPQAAPDRAPR